MDAFAELADYLKKRGELPGRRKALELLIGSPEVTGVIRLLWELDFWRERARKQDQDTARVCGYCHESMVGGPRCSNCGGL